MLRKMALSIISAGMLAVASVHAWNSQQTPPRQTPPAEAAQSPFTKCIAGSGLVEAKTENISIGSPHSGVLAQLDAHVGQRVKAGTPLFRLDDRHLQAERTLRQAEVAVQRARLTEIVQEPRPESIPVKEARLREAMANRAQYEDDWRRTQRLASNHAASEEQMIQKRQAFEAVKAQVAHAQAELDLVKAGSWEPAKALARAQLAEAEARLAQTEIELERLTVRAPIDGHILQVNVRVGEYVSSTQEKNALIVMGDLDCLHLRADVDEADVPRFDSTAQARAYLRGRPDKPFTLTFVRVEPALIPKRSLTGHTSERVDTRVLQVIYRIEPTEQPLYVGQQMDAFVEVSRLR